MEDVVCNRFKGCISNNAMTCRVLRVQTPKHATKLFDIKQVSAIKTTRVATFVFM